MVHSARELPRLKCPLAACAALIPERLTGVGLASSRAAAGFEPAAGDRWFFDDPLQVELVLEGTREYVRQGRPGYAWEAVAILQPWSFRLADISIPVHLWHGAQDPRVPLATQEFAAETISRRALHHLAGCGSLRQR